MFFSSHNEKVFIYIVITRKYASYETMCQKNPKYFQWRDRLAVKLTGPHHPLGEGC